MIRNLKIYLILFACSFCLYFKIPKEPLALPGKIAVNFDDSLYVFDNSEAGVYQFPIKGKNFEYGGLRWANNTNDLIGIEYLRNEKRAIGQGNLMCFNLAGKITKSIYVANHDEIAGHAYLSRKDKWILFATEQRGDIRLNPLEGLNRKKSLLILNYKTGKLVTKIEGIGTSLTFELRESPWVYDEDRFVYSVIGDKKIVDTNAEMPSVQGEKNGIYIYDVAANQKTLLIPEGRFAICSPAGFCIGYVKDQSIWIMDLKDKSTKKVFEVGAQDKIVSIHWTPDGKCIYIAYYKQNILDELSLGETLIDIKTIDEVPFKKIGHGFRPYTWK